METYNLKTDEHDSIDKDVYMAAVAEKNLGDRGVDMLCPDASDAPLHWYYMRASYGRGKMAYDEITAYGVDAFMPMQKVKKYSDGRMEVHEVYPLPSNIFVHCTESVINSLCCHSRYAGSIEQTDYSSIDFLDFAYDHTRTVDGNKNPRIIIPDSVMRRFIEASNIQHPGAHFVNPSEVRYVQDDYVRVTGGPFCGVVGRVAKLYGKKRVVVTIPGILAYTTAYVDSRFLEHIEKSDYMMAVNG